MTIAFLCYGVHSLAIMAKLCKPLAEPIVKGQSAMLSVAEVARILQVHQTTIYRWLIWGRLQGFKVDGVWYVDGETLTELTKGG